MAHCERCWNDARTAMIFRGGDELDHYYRIIEERQASGDVCTPEQQCGELHVEIEWADGTKMCRCRKAAEEGA